MPPTPIPPNTVHIILQYISPPSQINHPLPPFLLSKSLLQRHHFLHISPDDPQEYLCWPSSSAAAAQAIDLLESLPPSVHDDAPVEYPVQYTADDEYTYAHVNVSHTAGDRLRLVFQWDELDGWKFHDANLMPFPIGSQSSLRDVLAASSSIEDVRTHLPATTHDPYGFDTQDDGSDDDDYWNAYGAGDSDAPGDAHHPAKDAGANSEDAYWARYSSVHGTADSTQPSPLPQPRRKPQPLEDAQPLLESPHPLPVPVRMAHDDPAEEVLPIPPSIMSRPRRHSKWDPASPKALAHLLSAISPRQSPGPASAVELDETETEILSSLEGTTGSDASDMMSPPGLGLIEDGMQLYGDVGGLSRSRSFPFTDLGSSMSEGNGSPTVVDEEEAALRESLRGLYKLWRIRRGKKESFSDEGDREAFLRVVEEVISQ